MMSRFLKIWLVMALFIGPQAALSQQDTNPPKTSRIIEGTIGATTLFPALAEIFIEDGICTGTLIASEYVLTAGHCAFDDSGRQVSDMRNVSLIIGGKTRGAKSIHVNPKYKNTAEACTDGIPDASLIRLDSPITDIAPIPLASRPPEIGEQLLLVGFGMLGSGRNGQNGRFPGEGELAYGVTTVDKISSTFISWRFKAEPGRANTAGGDSGGPAFQTINGNRVLSGLTCGGTGNAEWGTESYDTRVDILRDWILPFLNQTSAEQAPRFRIPQSISAQAQKLSSHRVLLDSDLPATLSSSPLPPGLVLEKNTLRGIPVMPGEYRVTFNAENQRGKTSQLVIIAVKQADSKIAIQESLLKLDTTSSKSDSLTVIGQLRTSKALLTQYRRLTIRIGEYKQTFLVGSKLSRSLKSGDAFAVTRVASGRGNRISLRFKVTLTKESLLRDIRSFGLIEKQEPLLPQSLILPSVFEFAGNHIAIDQTVVIEKILP